MRAENCEKIISAYWNCPNCKSERFGNGQGTLDIVGKEFTRTCKCGYVIKGIETEKGEIKVSFEYLPYKKRILSFHNSNMANVTAKNHFNIL